MNDEELFKSMSAKVRDETPVEIGDVSAWVLRDIRNRRVPIERGVWEAIGGATCVLALVAAIFAGRAWSSFSNPLTDVVTVLPSE